MDFDFRHIAVPFRMQPGLARLEGGPPQLTPLAPGSALWEEKRRVLQAGQSLHRMPGFDAAPALAAIDREAGGPLAGPLELAFEEDLVVLDGQDTTLPWLCVCVPSHWAPEDKLGLPFAQVHAPVADNPALLASASHLVRLVTSGARWERWVWTITPSGRHDQHPARHARTPWPEAQDADSFASQCWLRAERQTFFPVGQGTRQAVFTIRVMLQPLTQAVRSRADALRLHDALASMSDAVLAYKGLTSARQALQGWLATYR